MSDLIGRQAAIDVAENAFVRGLLASPDIRRLPSVQPERKNGKWIKRDVSRQIHGISCSAPNYQCSVCKKWWFHNGEGLKWYKFCPECGADMRG